MRLHRTGLSEAVLDSELHDARAARLRLDTAERSGVQVGAGVAPIEVIQQVERLHSQLNRLAGGKGDASRQRQIDVPVAGTMQAVAHVIAKRAGRGLRERRWP